MAAVVTGIHHLKIPVTDLRRSRAWYERTLGLQVQWEFPDGDGVVLGLGGTIGGIPVALRLNPDAARGISGFDPICFSIADRAAAQAWIEHLDELGADHSKLIEATSGWMVQVHDPDGIQIRLYSTNDDIDHSSEKGFPRPVSQDAGGPG